VTEQAYQRVGDDEVRASAEKVVAAQTGKGD
jgi:hypothetical protein